MRRRLARTVLPGALEYSSLFGANSYVGVAELADAPD